jgi:hypothetical protein
MQVTKIKEHSISGLDGDQKCKITQVSPTELRFYAEISPNRESVLRDVKVTNLSNDSHTDSRTERQHD